jgi:hypothetical protein
MPEAEVETLVTPEMEERKGVWGNERVSYPVSESDIRKWAIAVYWGETPPRLYWDAEYARGTRWGGIIAPQDFNPFAWAVPTGAVKPAGAVPGQQTRRGGNVMNGGQADTYGVPMRPGDVITSRSRLSHWEERQGRNGLTLFTYTETEWRNQDGELVKTRISTGIRY